MRGVRILLMLLLTLAAGCVEPASTTTSPAPATSTSPAPATSTTTQGPTGSFEMLFDLPDIGYGRFQVAVAFDPRRYGVQTHLFEGQYLPPGETYLLVHWDAISQYGDRPTPFTLLEIQAGLFFTHYAWASGTGCPEYADESGGYCVRQNNNIYKCCAGTGLLWVVPPGSSSGGYTFGTVPDTLDFTSVIYVVTNRQTGEQQARTLSGGAVGPELAPVLEFIASTARDLAA